MRKKLETQRIERVMEVREIADDLSSMRVAYDEAVPAQPKRAPRGRRKVGRVFVMMDAPAAAKLRLSLREHRVLNALISLVNKETGEIVAQHGTIAEVAGLAQSHESVAMKALVARNIVIKLPRSTWRINRHIVFAGEWKDWDALARKDGEPLWEPKDLEVEERPALELVP